jgi:hypothetical protein
VNRTVFVGRCQSCKAKVSHGGESRVPDRSDLKYARWGVMCPGCAAWTATKAVRGFRSDTVCGPRCTGATGADCECQCVGVNHGADNRVGAL